MKCILKVTLQSVTHMQSFKEIYYMTHNDYEDLTGTAFKNSERHIHWFYYPIEH